MYPNEAMSQKSTTDYILQTQAKIKGENAGNLSPIAALIHDIDRMLQNAHEEASILENKIEPVRGAIHESETSAGLVPRELPPTMMEQHLQNLHDTARYLTNRIRKINAELRI
jgi:hypothetical protein